MREVNFQKMALARQIILPIGRHQITITRPSPWDVFSAQAAGQKLDLDWACGFVVDWNLHESDLFSGGDPEPVSFDMLAFRMWIKDRPDDWKPLIQGITDTFSRHEEEMAARGNA